MRWRRWGGSLPVGWLPGVGNPIVGTWRLTSFTEENLETGAVSYPFGVAARAFVIYEVNGYVATIFAAGDRKPPAAAQATEQEAIQLYRSMIAFSGRYELVGNRSLPADSERGPERTKQERDIFEVKGDSWR